MRGSFEVAVVGGGISGLATCYYLGELSKRTNQKINVTLFESGERLGGKITTDHDNGLTIEGGPDSFFTQKPWALDLCRELGLSERLVVASPATKGTYVLNGNNLSKLPEGTEVGIPSKLMPFLSSDLLTASGKIRALLDLMIPRRKQGTDESIGAFISRRFGRQFLEKIVEPLFAGIFAGDADQLSAQTILPWLKEMESTRRSLILGIRKARKNNRRNPKAQVPDSSPPTFVTLRGGLAQLTAAIASRLDHMAIMLGTGVAGIFENKCAREEPFEVLFEGGEKKRADIVVLATPAYVTAKIIKELDKNAAAILESIPYVSTATVSLAFLRDTLDAKIEGHGFLVPRTEEELVTGCTWESSKWPGHAPAGVILARCYVGWAGHNEFAQYEDEVLISRVRDFLRKAVGISVQPFFARVYRWDAAMPQYTVGHLQRIDMLEAAVTEHRGLFLTGAAFRGVGLPDCIHNASLTAQQIMKVISEDQKSDFL